MYKKSKSSWVKHFDFIVTDLICMELALFLAYFIRHGFQPAHMSTLYKEMSIFFALINLVIVLFYESYKNILRRGYWIEFKQTFIHVSLVVLCGSAFLVLMQWGDQYSRIVFVLMWTLYITFSYVARIIRKRQIASQLENNPKERRALLAIVSKDKAKVSIKNILENNYETFNLLGLCVLDEDMVGQMINDEEVLANKDTVLEYLCHNWVDEVFINVSNKLPYPEDLMGMTVHMKLAKVSSRKGQVQTVEKLAGYTVLTSSINIASAKQLFFKRSLDILGGVVGCICTGIIFLFVAPAIYMKSPGPIFFSQKRVGKNGKIFKMYKFRSMYMDAEKRKAELMAQNKIQDGMMFKIEDDPRIIGSEKKDKNGKSRGIGNFIRATSLDEFPQFFNVLKGDMSLVGNCYIIGTTKKNPVFSSVCPIG
ncbi:MAG: sugar transferase [Lachnospiraceae bacterium]|nr:sugar transferase [Lachnospiraceae bacterium]